MESGLVNLGNTCYLNSILQCLIYSDKLTKYFLSKKYIEDINVKEKFSDELESDRPIAEIITTKYHSFLEQMTSKRCIVPPVSIKRILDILSIKFRGTRQHDSHECLMFLLDILHMSLCYEVDINYKNNIEVPLSNESIQLEKKAIEDYKRYYKSSYSKIVELFHGQYCIKTECPMCQYKSYTFDPFTCVSLDLHENITTLKGCLERYITPELLDNDNLWECDKCKENVHATRKVMFWRLPKYLIIQLKRFKRIKVNNRVGFTKLDHLIHFDEDMSLKDYIHPERAIKGNYKLYAVSNHIGGLQGGHYYSYCKSNDNWVNFNDAQVSYMSNNSSIVTPNAYLLFYKLN